MGNCCWDRSQQQNCKKQHYLQQWQQRKQNRQHQEFRWGNYHIQQYHHTSEIRERRRRTTSPSISEPSNQCGVTLTEVSTDVDGTPRPQGLSYDIGAFEYR